jgi:hypothetical protein
MFEGGIHPDAANAIVRSEANPTPAQSRIACVESQLMGDCQVLDLMAGATGLEPATSSVTG